VARNLQSKRRRVKPVERLNDVRNRADSPGIGPLFDLTMISQVDVVAVSEEHLLLARQFVSSCESCCPTASCSFDYVLDEVTGLNPGTEYLLPELFPCPSCGAPIDAKTSVNVG
jgi:hypothetical protein